MEISWIKHVDSDKKAQVIEAIKGSKFTLDLLENILQKELTALELSSSEDYNIPNWAYLQADQNGYKRALKRFIKLINIKE